MCYVRQIQPRRDHRCSLCIVLHGGAPDLVEIAARSYSGWLGLRGGTDQKPRLLVSSETREPAVVIQGLQFGSFDRRSIRPVRPDRPTNRAGLVQELTRHLDR